MDLNTLASDLFGSKRAESGTTPSTVSMMYGVATADSADGVVSVWLSDNALSPSDAQSEWESVDSYDADAYEGMDESTSIEIPTEVTCYEGDVVRVQLAGAGAAKNPTVVGVVGRGDEETERLKAIEVDYVKATTLEADVAQIGFLKADSAVITNLQADTAKVHELTADELSAATAYIATLKAGSITAESLTADVAKVHNLTADQLSAAAGYISQLTADSVTAQNISAMYGDFATVKANAAKVANLTAQELEADHATIASLDSNYAHITNGVIDNATIGYADVNNLSAHYAEIQNGHINSALIDTAAIVDEQVFTVTGNKATISRIDASKINVDNLNADNITVNKINGQPVTGKSISDALSQHETDISTKVDTTTFNNTVDGLNDRIDGAIETFTGTVVPTLNNTPASAWNTTKLRDEHVGDVYYVVNANSQQNGYCYRFTKSGNTYSWQLIKDSDVTAALSRLQTAEGKITTFDSDISTLKTDTGELKTKTQSLETSLGDKVDVTTFNDLSSDVEENSATITTLSNTVSQKADSSTVSTLSNTVNQVKQTADTNKTSITNLTQTVNQKADSSTVTTLTQRTSTIEQNLSGITTRVGKTESTLETVSNPNLSPFFSMAKDDVYNASSNPNGYWKRIATNAQFTTYDMQVEHNGSGGWVHLAGNATSGNPFVRFEPMPIDTLKPSTKYTFVIDTDTISAASSINTINLQLASGKANSDAFDPFSAYMSFAAKGKTGTYYATGTTRADISDATVLSRSYLQVYGTGAFDLYIRLSLYEGEYSGPYKPYVDQTLSNRVKSAETTIDQTANNVLIKATASDTTAAQGGQHLIESLINVAPDGVKIDASKVEIDGTAVFNAISSDVDSAITGKGYATTTQVATAKSEAISAAATDATNKVNAVQIGGRNYILNSAGENISGLGSADGSRAEYRVLNVGQSYMSIAHDTQVTISFDLYMTVNTANPTILVYNANIKGPKAFSKSTGGTGNYSGVYLSFTAAAGSVIDKRVSVTGYINDRTSPTLTDNWLEFYSNYGSSNWFSISNIKLELGNKPTDWSPAPEDVDSQIDQSVAGQGGFTILWNYENFTKANNGEGYICALDPTTGTKSDESGWVMWNGVKRTIPKGMINPNAIHPYNTPCYVVCRLSSADATTGTNYIVSYNSGWKGGTIGAGALSEWTWNEGTDIIIGSYVEPSSEAAFIEMAVYNPPLSSKQLTTSNITAGRANATANAAAPKTAAVDVSERIYYRSNSSTKPSAPTSWVADATGNVWNAWTTKVPPLAANKNEGSIKYLYLWTCEQRKAVSGAFLGCTTVQLDENTTVIDGGNIITNSITANKLDAANINASNSLTIGAFQTGTQTDILNSNVQIGGRNLLRKTGNLSASDLNLARATVTEDGIIALTPTTSAAYASFKVHYLDFDEYGSGTYTVSFDAKLSDVTTTYTTSNVFAYLGFQDPTRVDSAVMNSTYDRYTPSRTLSSELTNEWQRFETVVDVPDDLTSGTAAALSSGYMMVVELGASAKKMPILIRLVKLERGTKATDWSPAPEDVDSSILSMQQDFNDQIDPINESIGNLTTNINDHGRRLATTEILLEQIKTIVDNLEDTTSWFSFNEKSGLIIGDNPSDGSSFFYTQQKGSFMSFNQADLSGSQELMRLSGSDGVKAPKITAEEVVTSRISSDWAISLDGDMFSIDYIGS